MSKSVVYKHYQRALAQWPKDILRPDVSFQTAMQRRIDRRIASSTENSQAKVIANDALTTVPTPARFDEKAEMEQANVLYSFLENRYTKKYPLSEHLMKPQSYPQYYDNLVKELDEAPTRSWLQRQINKWKGSLRMT
ncbi:hypothetical protein MMC34_006676 [Xylographa carneopallida]|nr:hypothetical protein [Xylographa carneopallida]